VYPFLLGNIPFFPVPGNHEYETDAAAPYVTMHAVPTRTVPAEDAGRYYSFDWGNAHFVCLDSNLPLERAARGQGQMLAWLDSDLRQTNQLWRIAVVHHAPYATGVNAGDPISALVRQRVVPILENNGVQLVLSGHEHTYQRTQPLRSGAIAPAATGVVYLASGGGGAGLYPQTSGPLTAFSRTAYHYLRVQVNEAALTVQAIDDNGQIFDTLALRATPRALAAPPDTEAPEAAG
jgi:3',5'-cyclic AMP phosphodiesterase CpdA